MRHYCRITSYDTQELRAGTGAGAHPARDPRHPPRPLRGAALFAAGHRGRARRESLAGEHLAGDLRHQQDGPGTARTGSAGVSMTDALIRDRKVDVRCLDCGAGSAWTAWCYRCSSTNLEMVPQKALRGPYSVQGRSEEPEVASVGTLGL